MSFAAHCLRFRTFTGRIDLDPPCAEAAAGVLERVRTLRAASTGEHVDPQRAAVLLGQLLDADEQLEQLEAEAQRK
jgi:hypothetical protein